MNLCELCKGPEHPAYDCHRYTYEWIDDGSEARLVIQHYDTHEQARLAVEAREDACE